MLLSSCGSFGHQQALQLEFLGQQTRIQVGQFLLAHGPGGRSLSAASSRAVADVALEREKRR